ncbi:hypothetical protein F5Y04DRAFT_62441 [Hypomontagnella monticulosa]|nr:hypothetical protein F5Y04DRAFT_62441 [Hypomontagnella monticulosa]
MTVNTKKPMRITVNVSCKHNLWSKAWDTPTEVIEAACGVLKEEHLVDTVELSDIRFIAKERWQPITFIVFDIFHTTYRPETAHIASHNTLPVVMVYFNNNTKAMAAPKLIEDKVNEEVRDIHDNTGLGSQPPYAIDHMNGNIPSYPRPRSTYSR